LLASLPNGIKRILAGLTVVGFPTLIYFAITHRAFMNTYGPKCVVNELTGLYCPGCGGTRAVYALAQGDWVKALHCNLLIPITLSLLVYVWWALARFAVEGRWIGLSIKSHKLSIAIAILVVTFAIVRNIPCYPFSLLVPY
jgi:hypothetical protein